MDDKQRWSQLGPMRYRARLLALPAITTLLVLTYLALTSQEPPRPALSSPPTAPSTPVPWVSTSAPPLDVDRLSTPLAGQPVAVTLMVREPGRHGERLHFTVRLTNAGNRPIPLQPCPHYRVQLIKVVESGYLNCAAAPSAIPAKGHVVFAMTVRVNAPPPLVVGRGELLWQLGGEGTEGATAVAEITVRNR
jgi:hypothetical protein